MPPFAAKTLGNNFSLFPSANMNGPIPRPALAVQTQQKLEEEPVRTKTNTRLPDMLPSMDAIRFDPLGGPFPVFNSNGQSGDPLGLNAFLLHPDDGLWNYLQPAPRNDVGAKGGRGDGARSGSESESENERSDLGSMARKARQNRRQSLGVTSRSPLSGPPLVNPEVTELGTKEEGSTGVAATESMTSTMRSRFGLKKGLKLVKSGTNLAAAAKAAKPPAVSASQPSSPTRGDFARPPLDRGRNSARPLAGIPDVPSIPQRFMDAARSESTHSRSTATDSEAGPATPRDSPKELVDIVDVPGKKTMLGATSGWKSWLSAGQASKQKKAKEGPAVLTKQPKKLNEAPKADPGLSADPLAGVLPSSIPLRHSTSVNEALNLPARTRSPMPDQLRAVRTLSIRKLAALRAPSPHPVLPLSSIPAYLAHHGSDSTSSASYMKFPRSVNCRQVPGMGLGPAQAGMRIDVAVRTLLSKIDAGNVDSLDEINALVSAAGNKHLNSGMAADLIQIKRMKSLNAAKRTPGVVTFIKRPGFEDRMAVYGPDGLARRVESDRAVYEIEYSMRLEALSREAASLAASHKSGVKSRPPVPKSRLSDESAKTNGSGNGSGGRSGSTTPEGDNERNDPTPVPILIAPPPALKQFPSQETVKQEPARTLAARTRSAPAPVGVSPLKAPSQPKARNSVIQWDMTSDSESSESEEEESDSEDENTLAGAVGRSMKRSSLLPAAAPQQSARPASMTRPTSFAAQPVAQVEAARRTGQESRRRDGDRQAEEDMAEKYRAQVMQTRERRELARSGLIERQRASDAMREQASAKRSSHTSPTSSTTNRAHRKSLSAASTPTATATHPHRASIGMLPVPQAKQADLKRLSASSGRVPTLPVSPPNLNNRRSLSHMDISNMARQSIYGTPTAMMPMMPYQGGQPGMMFMQMPLMAYQQTGMGYMPMNGVPQQYHQNVGAAGARPQDRERRRSSVAPVSHQQTAARRHGGRSGRASPIQ